MKSWRRCWQLAQRSTSDAAERRADGRLKTRLRQNRAFGAHRRLGNPREQQRAKRKPVPERCHRIV